MPTKSKLGHLHFKVIDLSGTARFYELLGFSLKYIFGSNAYFYALGDYHHQIALNSWAGNTLSAIETNSLGMASYTLVCLNQEIFNQFKHRLKKANIPYESSHDQQQLLVADPNGIKIYIK